VKQTNYFYYDKDLHYFYLYSYIHQTTTILSLSAFISDMKAGNGRTKD